jgi:hypothetical protein
MNAKSIWPLLAAALLLGACARPSAPEGGLSLVATVGTEADVCADTAEINVFSDAPTTVYYCYTITNTGELMIPLHGLADDVFGVVLRDFAYELAPGESVDTVAAGLELAYEVTDLTVNAATWDGFLGSRRLASAEASTTVTPVPPLQYGAVAGTFVADGNLATVGAYAANLIVLAVQTLAGEPVEVEVPVDITVPGYDTFTYLFDPATAEDGRVVLIFGDGSVTPVSATRLLGMPVETVAFERQAGLSTSAVVGGDFTFAFPGETLVRTVDAEAALAVPAVEDVFVNLERDQLSVVFTEDGGDGVAYLLEAYGRGTNGYAGIASGTGSPVVVELNGPLGPDEAYAIDILAVRGADFDPFLDPVQLDVAEFLYASEEN